MIAFQMFSTLKHVESATSLWKGLSTCQVLCKLGIVIVEVQHIFSGWKRQQ